MTSVSPRHSIPEDALRETSRTLHALIEASPLAVVVSDASCTVHVWNPAAVRMLGWTETEKGAG
ncbi:PAS domain-containing protein [Candidatus Deferrimicrobium sp.]|uniref:PAS domain-containing protein n=1 Tax=Candidatus Deferrimicrobium sp. TaxID=3060586 RepID=UPI0032C23001